MCKALGYGDLNKKEDIDNILKKQHPHIKLVYSKFVKSWCMTPIKQKSRPAINAFAQGKKAEPFIHNAVKTYFTSNFTHLKVKHLYTTGLVQKKNELLISASPDAMCIISYPKEIKQSKTNDYMALFQERNLISKFATFVTEMGANLKLEVNDTVEVVSVIEYKHKSSIGTINTARNIVHEIGKIKNTIVLIIGTKPDDPDAKLFRKFIPEIDYRFQILHECLCTATNICMYIVATTKIEYILIICFKQEVLDNYCLILKELKKRFLKWMFIDEDMTIFDLYLKNMPAMDIDYGYASDRSTVKCRLQIMMRLCEIQHSTAQPIPESTSLIPAVVGLWNSLKGGIDDFSRTLSHNLAKWGCIAPTSLLIIRVFSALLYNSWRIYSLLKVKNYLLSDSCDTYLKFQKQRLKLGGTFENFLFKAFLEMQLPTNVATLPLMVQHSPSTRKKGKDSSNEFMLPKYGKKGKIPRWFYNTPEFQQFRCGGTKRTGRDQHHRVKLSEFYHTNRTFCVFCTICIYDEENKKGVGYNVYNGECNGRKPTYGCALCRVPLCGSSPCKGELSCFERWHSVKNILMEPRVPIEPVNNKKKSTETKSKEKRRQAKELSNNQPSEDEASSDNEQSDNKPSDDEGTDSDGENESISIVSSLSESTGKEKTKPVKKRKRTGSDTPLTNKKTKKKKSNEETPLTSNKKHSRRKQYNLRESARKNYSYGKRPPTKIVGVRPKNLNQLYRTEEKINDNEVNNDANVLVNDNNKEDNVTDDYDKKASPIATLDDNEEHTDNDLNLINESFINTSFDTVEQDNNQNNASAAEVGKFVLEMEDTEYVPTVVPTIVPAVTAVCSLCSKGEPPVLKKCQMCTKFVHHLTCVLLSYYIDLIMNFLSVSSTAE